MKFLSKSMIIYSPMQTPCYDILGDSFNQAMQRRLATAAESSTIKSVLLSSMFSDCRIVGSYISSTLIGCCCRRHSDWFYSTRLGDRRCWRRLATVEETMSMKPTRLGESWFQRRFIDAYSTKQQRLTTAEKIISFLSLFLISRWG